MVSHRLYCVLSARMGFVCIGAAILSWCLPVLAQGPKREAKRAPAAPLDGQERVAGPEGRPGPEADDA